MSGGHFRRRQGAMALAGSLLIGASLNANADNAGQSDPTLSGEKKATTPAIKQPGAFPNVVGGDKNGVWQDLPRTDASWASAAEQKDRKKVWNLTDKEQAEILHSRAKTGMMLGSFYEFNNLLFCSQEPFLMTTSVDVSKMPLHTVHIKSYKPTQSELFETEARQTQTTIKYDPTFMSKWIAVPPAMALPYTLNIADGWHFEDRGMYISYAPKIAPIGMDVYMMGRYSNLSPEQMKAVRVEKALDFMKMLDPTSSEKSLKESKVDGCDAVYFECGPIRRPDCKWRQWSFIKNGEAFVIVSSIDNKNESALFPQVQSMVNSFHVIDPPPASVGL